MSIVYVVKYFVGQFYMHMYLYIVLSMPDTHYQPAMTEIYRTYDVYFLTQKCENMHVMMLHV